jgi:hypothetical protein
MCGDRPRRDGREHIPFAALAPNRVVGHQTVDHVLGVIGVGRQAVDRKQCARRVMTDQRMGVVDRLEQRRHGAGIVDIQERQSGRHPLRPLIAAGEHVDDGGKPAPIATDSPQRFGQIDQTGGDFGRRLLGPEQPNEFAFGPRERSTPSPITARASGMSSARSRSSSASWVRGMRSSPSRAELGSSKKLKRKRSNAADISSATSRCWSVQP